MGWYIIMVWLGMRKEEHQTERSSLSWETMGLMRLVTLQSIEWSSGKQEVMIDMPAASPQRSNGTTEQKTNMKLMSKAFCFCLWSCIGVISEEDPCPCIKHPPPFFFPHWGSGMRRSRASHWGNGRSGQRAMSQGSTGLEVTASLWLDEPESCDAKRLFWHHDWAP